MAPSTDGMLRELRNHLDAVVEISKMLIAEIEGRAAKQVELENQVADLTRVGEVMAQSIPLPVGTSAAVAVAPVEIPLASESNPSGG